MQGQYWKKIIPNALNSDTSVIYNWEEHNSYHSAYGKLVFLKSGRFIFNSQRPFGSHEYSEGDYTIKKDTLILNSDFREGNLEIKVEYSENELNETPPRRLSFARNLNGKLLRKARYLMNYDTAIDKSYYADFPMSFYANDFLYNITALKLEVYPGISSQWIPILKNRNYLIVTVLSHIDFNEFKPRILTNYKLLKSEDTLIDFEGGL